MKNVINGQTLFVGDAYGVLVRPEIRDGVQVFVDVSWWNSWDATDPEVQGLTVINEGDLFAIEGEPNVYIHGGYDEEEGYPLLHVAPRSMVG